MVDKKLQDYLLDARKEYDYTIRWASDIEPTEKQLARLKANLGKYEVISISKPKSSIFQSRPYGFANNTHSPVVIFKIKTGLPASNFYLSREVAKCFGSTENLFVTHESHLDPEQLNIEPLNLDTKKDYKAGAPIDIHTDYAKCFGNDFNENFLKTILAARKKETERICATATNPSKK